MNILVIGNSYENIVSLIKTSKYDFKLYTASDNPADGVPNIVFKNISELIEKAKILQIDISINLNELLILDNICEEFKKNKLNLVSINKKWLNLEISKLATKKLMEYYSINFPKIIKIPINFPVIMKSDFPEINTKISSQDELIDKLKLYKNIKTFFEEYLNDKYYSLISFWDGKNIFHLNPPQNMTEVQFDRFDLFKTKLNFLLSDEKADFTGFFTTKLVWAKNDWYIDDFKMSDDIPIIPSTKYDFLHILDCLIYQNLNEL